MGGMGTGPGSESKSIEGCVASGKLVHLSETWGSFICILRPWKSHFQLIARDVELTYVKHRAHTRLLILICTALCSHLLTKLSPGGRRCNSWPASGLFLFPLDLASGQLTRPTGCLNFPGTCGSIQELRLAFGGTGGGQGGSVGLRPVGPYWGGACSLMPVALGFSVG